MRIWDIPPRRLCRKHLAAEHSELHALWTILTEDKKGYSRHPETLRWKGRLRALYNRHTLIVEEMTRRGWSHRSPLDEKLATGSAVQTEFVNTVEEQERILREKDCDCLVDETGEG